MNLLDAKRKLLPLSGYMGGGSGGGGGGTQQSTNTTYQTNIPEYAKPYVETMLGATQKQLFQGTPTEGGGFDITGFQPYRAYGGTYDAAGNQTSYDPGKSIAGFQPMQQQAMSNAANMQSNPETFMQGIGGYMSPFAQYALQPQLQEAARQSAIQGTQQQAQATQAGAFGGGRDALMRSERERNLGQNQANIMATGMQNAFNQAQQQYNTGFQQNLGINALQSQLGGQQQALEQQKINQSMQDFANAQQYPLMQLGTMSNMLRGLPMQASTTNQYVAAPNSVTQAIGAVGAGTSLYNAMKGAEGGLPSEFKQSGIMSYAEGGQIDSKMDTIAKLATIAKDTGNLPSLSYSVGGGIKSKLYDMDQEALQEEIKNSDSPALKRMAQAILEEKKSGAALAGGGIIAFNDGKLVPPPTSSEQLHQRVMQAKPTGDITAAPIPMQTEAPPPREQGIAQATVQPPPEPQVEDTLSNLPPFYKALYNKANTTAGKTRQEIAAELEQEAGSNVGAQEQRAKLMAERTNAEDEAKRQRYMRLAEFFGRWGSTPGPTLVAGLNAVKESVPNFIADEKTAKDIRMKIDNSIGELDQATRLEKKGYTEKAEAIKEKEAANMMKVQEFLARAQEDKVKIDAENKKQADYLIGQAEIHRQDAEARAQSDKEIELIRAKYHKEVENIRGTFGLSQARISAASHEKGYAMQNQHHDQRAVDTLLGEERKAQADIDRVKKDLSIQMNIIEMAKNPNNNVSPEQVAMARKAVEERLGDAPARLEGIRAERQRVQDRLAGKKPSDAPANDPLGVR